ncbi:hypothetical protein P154DRAFT_609175 [Amniculicola lignicola CBS 123094]|uniref:Uncharacterized protein n=1 Tax=Amniculicola lignicola CBS 123094 TaxID=1392246 RepID=A0A6A5W5T5_9PLEO|nr:hypothetical protein P154DRAFT_609175 [Amniculicola lignicola CBS 123094]
MARWQRRGRFGGYAAMGSVAGITCWKFWSRKSYFEEFTPATDKLFCHPLLKTINPHNSPSIHDSCVRKVPFSQVQPEVLGDHRKGGSKLITTYCQGIWGGYGFAIQRRLENLKTKNKDSKGDLWTAEQLLGSEYNVGEVITDHFTIIEKTNDTILLRGMPVRPQCAGYCGYLDSIGELNVRLNEEEECVEFRFKKILFSGAEGPKDKPPFPAAITMLHYQYMKLLVESGVCRCSK